MRTWEENRSAINGLWPQCQWSEEERRLLVDDLSPLDQGVLYDALRNVKRSRDTLYPQLKWFLDEYRELTLARKKATAPLAKSEAKLLLSIDDAEDKRLADEFCAYIDVASPSDFGEVEHKVLHVGLPKMHSRTALRVLNYARRRLLGQTQQFGKVLPNGDIQPITFAGVA